MPFTDKPVPAPQDDEYAEVAWGKTAPDSKISPLKINRHKVGDLDVKFEMLYCGICHTDIHFGENELGGSMYPMVPGHELVGKVVEVGPKVTKFKVGDNVGVGCMIDSCLECKCCKEGDENFCATGSTFTYNAEKKYKGVGGNKDT